LDPIVRVSVGSIRERLCAYFGTEGHNERYRLEIPRGQYRLEFVEAVGDGRSQDSIPALNRFWQPYLQDRIANIIVYTEPLFFHDGRTRFFRDWEVNRLPEGAEQIRSRYPGLESEDVRPVFHYLSAGEMHCLLSLTRMFHEQAVPVETRNSRNVQWHELSRSNLVLLGSPRTNSFLESLQGDQPLVVLNDHIERRSTGVAEQSWRGTRFVDGHLPRMREYAVVTRRPGVVPGSCVTMIAANHGRAIEGAGHMLTLEDRVGEILARIDGGSLTELPGAFQILMCVDTVDVDDEVVSVECAEYHVSPKASAAS
jgi:hypothetical protein